MKRQITLLLITFALFAGVNHSQSNFVDGVELTTIKAPWTLRILGNDLDITKVQVRPNEQSAYFMMTSESSKLNVSVFIEPVDKCKTSEECRDFVLSSGNPAWGKFQDLAKSKIKDFHYFEFYRPEAMGRPLKMLDMYAEYVDQGYWVDVHLSKVLYTKGDHALFEKVINSINFIPKSGAQHVAFDTVELDGDKTVSAWLGLWDTMKCRESYVSLSSLTKQDNSERSWVEYCEKVNNFLGAKSSRKLIGVAFTKSLPTKTEQPVAVFAYHSNFANRTAVVEIVALMLEKDGKWIVTNYLPQ